MPQHIITIQEVVTGFWGFVTLVNNFFQQWWKR